MSPGAAAAALRAGAACGCSSSPVKGCARVCLLSRLGPRAPSSASSPCEAAPLLRCPGAALAGTMPGPRASVRSSHGVRPDGAENGAPSKRPVSRSLSGSEDYDVSFKVMLLGDSAVGKTSTVMQYKDGAFLSGTFLSTVGIDYRNKVVTVDGIKVKLQIWDTAGQERFRSVTHAYYRDAEALLLLYDITNRTSFDNIRAWLTEIGEYAQKDVVIMLLGNKCDMNHERVIRSEEGENLAKEYGVPFMETSAKTGLNVEVAFLAVAKELKQRAGRYPDQPTFQIHEYIEAQKKKSSCCSFH